MVKWLALALLCGCDYITGGFETNPFSGDAFPTTINSQTGALLTGFYAEEHPSDANYVAFAAGSSYGLPLTDPEEENPLYTIDAPNIGDLVDAQGESWKAYLQSAYGPLANASWGWTASYGWTSMISPSRSWVICSTRSA